MLLTAGAAAHLGRLARPGIGVVSISGGACDIVADRARSSAPRCPPSRRRPRPRWPRSCPGTGRSRTRSTSPAPRSSIPRSSPARSRRSPRTRRSAWSPSSTGCRGCRRTGPTCRRSSSSIGAGMQQAAVPCVYVNQVLQPVTDVTRASMVAGGVLTRSRGCARWSSPSAGWAGGRSGRRPWRPSGPGPSSTWPSRPPRPARVRGPRRRRRGLLADAGIPVVPAVLAGSADEAAKAAAEFGGPVALKVCSPQIVHKSDVGGVRLGVGAGDVRAAYAAVAAAAAKVDGAELEGVLVSPMRSGGVELLVGVVRDPHWGPILAVALGGVFVEVLKDSALAPLPVTPERAERLLRGLRAAAVLDGVAAAPRSTSRRSRRWSPGSVTWPWPSATSWSPWRSTLCGSTAARSRPSTPSSRGGSSREDAHLRAARHRFPALRLQPLPRCRRRSDQRRRLRRARRDRVHPRGPRPGAAVDRRPRRRQAVRPRPHRAREVRGQGRGAGPGRAAGDGPAEHRDFVGDLLGARVCTSTDRRS